jgi:hypothetical protein
VNLPAQFHGFWEDFAATSAADPTLRFVDAFHEWKAGPRQSLIDKIDTNMKSLIWLSDSAMESRHELNIAAWPAGRIVR